MYKVITVLGLLLLSAACSSISTQSDFDAGTDFSNYKTFAFISDSPLIVAQAEPVNPLFEGRVMTATRNELTNKGFQFVENRDQADFVISFTMGSRDKIRVNSYPSTYRGGPGGWGWGAPYYNTDVDVQRQRFEQQEQRDAHQGSGSAWRFRKETATETEGNQVQRVARIGGRHH